LHACSSAQGVRRAPWEVVAVVDVVLTTDRTMMTNHHGKEFLGFGTTGVPVIMPERFWFYLFAPRVRTDGDGRPREAPYGLRKIEAALLDAGIDAAIVDPSHLDDAVKGARVIMLSHHDYFGFGPPSSTFATLFEAEPLNARSFRHLMESAPMRDAKKRGVKIIAGGPAAWQWRYREEDRRRWGIDTVVEGEGERIAVDLARRALKGEALPEWVVMPPNEAPGIDEIPLIKGPAVNGMVEIMRGCPRGCKFCSVTLRPLRHIPLERIEKEILINKRGGLKGTILHSEDVLLYGAKGVKPEGEKVYKVNVVAKRHMKIISWSHLSVAALVYAERNGRWISRIMDEVVLQGGQRFLGVEVGVETGSERLTRLIMPAKAAPYPPEEWRELVIEAAGIMEDNRILPAMTLIAGLPEESEEDVLRTIELVDDLWDFRGLIVPLFFVPMGILSDRDWFRKHRMSDVHMELLKRCLTHGIRQSKSILKEYFSDSPILSRLISPFLHLFIWEIERYAKKYGFWSEPDTHCILGDAVEGAEPPMVNT